MERDPQLTLQGERLLEHHAWLRSLAEDLAADPSHADDVVQETFLAALTCRGDSPRRAVPWLRTVLRNCIRQSYRARARRRRREERAARPERVIPTADRDFELEELRARLAEHVARLREPYRSTIVLHYFSDQSLEEIARREGVPSATVRTRLRRALAELRRRLPSRDRGVGAVLVLGLIRPRRAAAALRRATVRAGAGGAEASRSSGLSIAGLSTGGVMQIGIKSVTIASVISAGLLGTVSGLYLLERAAGEPTPDPPAAVRSPERRPAPARSQNEGSPALELARAASGVARAPEPRAPAAALARKPAASLSLEAGRDEQGIAEPVSEAALALRRDYDELRRLFNESSTGWKLVGENIANLREVIAGSDEGFDEFLALIDNEKDGPFLEAILHHLPLKSGSPFQKEIVEDEELQAELWARFEEETDGYRRRSFLRFFCYNPELSVRRMERFSEIALRDESPIVRELGMDAISSAGFPKETWPALCEIAEHEADESLRALAVRGLAGAGSERAGEIYRAAFSSESEAIRAAAVSAHRDESPPPEAVGGDYTAYLVRELRAASTKEHREAFLDRLLAVSPLTLLHEAERALRSAMDRQASRQYREAIERARERIERRE